MFTISPLLQKKIAEYFLKEYPKEACGFILKPCGTRAERLLEFFACDNIAEEPCDTFEISAENYLSCADRLVAIVHSHPGGTSEPTKLDMQSQMTTNVKWGIAHVSADYCSNLMFWGSEDCVPPVLGRTFRHGPSGTDGAGDCYALIKDWYKQELEITLPEFPRDNEWWQTGDNMYDNLFEVAGFREIKNEQLKKGDVFFMSLGPHVTVNNHAGIFLKHNVMLHHLAHRLSSQETIGYWAKYFTKWVRYYGNK